MDAETAVQEQPQATEPQAPEPTQAPAPDPYDFGEPRTDAEANMPADDAPPVTPDVHEEPPAQAAPKPERAATDTQAEVDAGLVREATDYGYSEAAAQVLAERGLLERELVPHRRKALEAVRQQQAQPQPPAQEVPPPQPETKPYKFDRQSLLDKGFDPELVDEWEAMNKAHEAEAAASKALLEELKSAKQREEQYRQAEQQQQFASWVDGQFKSLGADWEPVFGKGTVSDIDRAGQEYKARVAVIRAFDDLTEVYQKRVQSGEMKALPPRETIFQRALNLEHADRFQQQIETKARQQARTLARDEQGRFVAPPTHRESSNGLTPTQRAMQAVEEQRLAAGMPPSLTPQDLQDDMVP